MANAQIKPERADPVVTVFGAVPLVCIAFFYVYVVRARLALGFWPAPDYPDPMTLGYTFHHDAIVYVLMFAVMSPIAMAGMVLVRWLMPAGGRSCGEGIALFTASYVILWVLYLADPGTFFEWYVG
ncbi:MAG: hypothetical protein ACYTDY_15065 [Planctomycetota bacterium]